jgi:hypothetical protein
MMFVRTKCIAVTLIGMLFSYVVHADAVAQKQVLPRSFGPLTLGITEEVFKKVTGVTPEFCHHCAQDETTTAVYIEKHSRVYPEYLYSLPKNDQGFGCKFYKGKLYLIEASPEISEINAAKKHYTALYGPPSKMEDWSNGVSWVTWENKTTAFVLAYDREKSGAFWHTIPAGTVTFVQYIDKPLRNALEAQEKKRPTRASHEQ